MMERKWVTTIKKIDKEERMHKQMHKQKLKKLASQGRIDFNVLWVGWSTVWKN